MNTLKNLLWRTSSALIAAAMSFVVVACQGDPDALWEPVPEGEPLLAQLGVPAELAIAPSAAPTRGSFAAARGHGPTADAEFELAVEGGVLELWSPSDGVLFIRHLTVDLAPIAIDPAVLPPRGALLTDVQARLARPVTVLPADDGRTASVIAHVDLEASWSMLIGDTAHPARVLSLDRVPVSLELERNALGQIQARLVGFREGAFFRWAGALELSDLTLDLVAHPDRI